jgi:hypothetical protein
MAAADGGSISIHGGKVLIVLSAKNSPNYPPIYIEPLPDTDLEGLSVRVSRSATIDGAGVITHFGMTDADRAITINAQLTKSENDQLSEMMNNETEFRLVTDEGLFSGVIESRTGDGGRVSIRFLTVGAYSTPTTATDPPTEATIENTTSGYVTDRSSDGMTYEASYSVPIWLGYIDPSASSMGRMTAFVLFDAIDLPSGGVISATLNFPGGMWTYMSSNFSTYDIKNKIYCHDIDSSSVPADRSTFLAYPYTTTYTQWDFNVATSVYDPVTTPDISDPINEVLNRGGWTSGNNLMIIIQADEYPGNGVSVRGQILIQYPFTGQDYPAELIVTY